MCKMVYHIDEIEKIAEKIIPLLSEKVVLLEGEMGAGKTTLTRNLVKVLGVQEGISSPSFGIVNEYSNGIESIFHFDFYRIKNEAEALDFGVEEYLYSGNWCFLEWSERIQTLLPEKVSRIFLRIKSETQRELEIK